MHCKHETRDRSAVYILASAITIRLLMLLGHDRKIVFKILIKDVQEVGQMGGGFFFISQGAGDSIRSACMRKKYSIPFSQFSVDDITRYNLLHIPGTYHMHVCSK